MSVLVEALSLIVPRKVLDVSYPGGTSAFMLEMCKPDVPCRLVCADEHLVSVSFHGASEAQVVGGMLMDRGIVAVDDDRFVEMAFIDQHHGLTMPCDWLEWRRHRDGFTYCWLAGTEPGDMHTPADWTPEQSRALTRTDIRDEPGRCLQLAEEGDLETWLDFETGAVIRGHAHRDAHADVPPAAQPDSQPAGDDLPLLAEIIAELRAAEQQSTFQRTMNTSVRHANEPDAPIPNSYWLDDASLVAGEYPGAPREADARGKIGALLDAGVRSFVDLTRPDDLLTPYDTVLAEEAARRGVQATRHAMPIRDMDVTAPDHMRAILALLDAEIAAGRTPYVHCWGGVGRTGLVVGCHLVRRGATGDEALDTVRRLFATMSADKVRRHRGRSPQTGPQLAMVRGWAAHDQADGTVTR